jgi:hypothetical protein
MIKFETLSQREEKCINSARKQVQLYQKWGRWNAAPFFLLAIFYAGLAVTFLLITIYMVRNFLGLQPNPNQPQINAIKQGFGLGLLFGFFSGWLFYKGIFFFYKSIDFLRGDCISHLLIKYHDGILALMQNQNDDQLEISNDQQTN